MDIMWFNKGEGIQGTTPRKLAVSRKPGHSRIYAVRSEPIEMPDQWRIPQYKFCHCAPEWVEFRKVVEINDMGIVIYRYMAADEEDDGGPSDIFVVQDTKGNMELKRTIIVPDTFAKCITDCPVCRKILDRAETLLLSVPWVNRRGLVAVCDGLHKGDCVFCPTCSTVADKFFSFIRSAHRKTTGRRVQVEDAMKAALELQAGVKETGKEKAVGKEKEEVKKKGVKEGFGTIKRTASDFQDTTEGSKVKEGTEINQKKDVQKELETGERLAPDSKETTGGSEVKKGKNIIQKNDIGEEKDRVSKEVGKEKKIKQESESTKRTAPDFKDTTEGSEKKKERSEKKEQEKAVAKRSTVGSEKERQDRTDEVEENLKGAQKVSSRKIGKKDKAPAKADAKPPRQDRTDEVEENIKGAQKVSSLKTGKKDKALAKADAKQPRQDRTDEVEENLKGAQKVSSLKTGKIDNELAKAIAKQRRQKRTDEVKENLKGAQKVSSLKIGKKDKADDKQQKVKGKKGDQKANSDTKLTSQQEIKSASPKTLRKSKSTVEREKAEVKARKEKEQREKKEAKAQQALELTQVCLMRKLINEQLKDADRNIKMQKEHDKLKSDIEKKAAAAEKKVEEDERKAIAREKEAAAKPTVPIPPTSESSSEHPPSSIVECGDGAVEEITDMVKSEKIVAYKDVKALPSELPVVHTPKPCPPVPQSIVASAPATATPTSRSNTPPITIDGTGVKRMTYTLSDRKYIEKGWTQLPKEVLMRQFTIFHMDRARPEFDWFELNRHKVRMYYDSGELLARFDEGRCCLFYRSGKIALDYYEAEDTQARLRLVVYSTGEPVAHGRLRSHAVLAAFDYAGNGVVFDHAGNVRLKYNQTEGIVLDKDIGPESHWKWHCLNEPPLFTTVIMDTTLTWKDPTIQKLGEKLSSQNMSMNDEVNSGMLKIEMGNIARKMAEQRQRKFTPFKIRMKAVKINLQFSLKVLDQATIYLNFCDGATNLKINVGMVLNPTVIVGTEMAEVGEISNFMDNALARIVLRY